MGCFHVLIAVVRFLGCVLVLYGFGVSAVSGDFGSFWCPLLPVLLL